MAGNLGESGPPLTRAELALLACLTRALAEAVAQGDLDRALEILTERQRALKELTWPEVADGALMAEFRAVKDLEQKILEFCRTWQKTVAERLKLLNQGQVLRVAYAPPEAKSRFINMSR